MVDVSSYTASYSSMVTPNGYTTLSFINDDQGGYYMTFDSAGKLISIEEVTSDVINEYFSDVNSDNKHAFEKISRDSREIINTMCSKVLSGEISLLNRAKANEKFAEIDETLKTMLEKVVEITELKPENTEGENITVTETGMAEGATSEVSESGEAPKPEDSMPEMPLR